MKIYTKKGDGGKTRLLNGCEVMKDCILLRVVGEVDELNCMLGVALAHLEDEARLGEVKKYIMTIQTDLFKVGAELSALQSDVKRGVLISANEIKEFENKIDEWWGKMPELREFIIPGGEKSAGFFQYSRAICRRAERELVNYGKEVKIRQELYQYLNRLSDFLFTVARWINFK